MPELPLGHRGGVGPLPATLVARFGFGRQAAPVGALFEVGPGEASTHHLEVEVVPSRLRRPRDHSRSSSFVLFMTLPLACPSCCRELARTWINGARGNLPIGAGLNFLDAPPSNVPSADHSLPPLPVSLPGRVRLPQAGVVGPA